MSIVDHIPLNALPFGQLAFTANHFVLDHLRRIRQVFDLDLDIAFVFGSLAHLNVQHKLHPLLPPTEALNLQNCHEFRAVQLRDVVQVTGLPRETVRRYLVKLEENQKVYQTSLGKWCVRRDSITSEMVANTMVTIKNLLQASEDLQGILDRSNLKKI